MEASLNAGSCRSAQRSRNLTKMIARPAVRMETSIHGGRSADGLFLGVADDLTEAPDATVARVGSCECRGRRSPGFGGPDVDHRLRRTAPAVDLQQSIPACRLRPSGPLRPSELGAYGGEHLRCVRRERVSYPPGAIFLFLPITFVPFREAFAAWTGVSVGCLALTYLVRLVHHVGILDGRHHDFRMGMRRDRCALFANGRHACLGPDEYDRAVAGGARRSGGA